MTTASKAISSVFDWLTPKPMRALSEDDFQRERAKLLTVTPIPSLWLFGKTQSGKTSIVKFLTGAENARIGSGFRPETRTTFEYDFPSLENVLVRFLDTRGLGEANYDPAPDIRALDERTHLMIVTVRVTDLALEPLLEPLREIRRNNPKRPILLAMTCLHETYPGKQHPAQDPFATPGLLDEVSEALRRRLLNHSSQFKGLYDRMVAIDFTPPEEGFEQPTFGGDRFKQALLDLLPAAYGETIRTLDQLVVPLKDLHERRAMPFVYSFSSMAASAAAMPIPWIDIPTVIGLQVRLVRKLGELYGQSMAVDQILSMAGVVGTRVLLRQGIRELLKAIPIIGTAANAALAYATTFALGKAACWYFGRKLVGQLPSNQEFQSVLKEQIKQAEQFWKQHRKVETKS